MAEKTRCITILAVLLFWIFSACAESTSYEGVTPESVAVIVNNQDANSVEIGQYYLQARNIPTKNLILVSFEPGKESLNPKQFQQLREQIYEKLSPNIEAITLAWTNPFAVNCNSITAAMTFGYDEAQCKETCAPGNKSPYFNSSSRHPNKDHNLRLSILLPTDNTALAKAIIDRGVLSSFKLSDATGYFLKTKDKMRSKPRERFYPPDLSQLDTLKIHFRTLNTDSIRDKKDIMFYFTGMKFVPDLETNNFLPGALADHLTSRGGVLSNTSQMSILRWLEAGATGSYGTVSEPCNHWQKFSNPQVLLRYYLAGETLIEAYWKSVYWPAQGLLVGEPLAAPYRIQN